MANLEAGRIAYMRNLLAYILPFSPNSNFPLEGILVYFNFHFRLMSFKSMQIYLISC